LTKPKHPTYIDVIPRYFPTDEDLIDAAVSGDIFQVDKSFGDIRKGYGIKDALRFLKKLIRLGHTSVLEHIVFRFLVSGSRAKGKITIPHHIRYSLMVWNTLVARGTRVQR